VELSVKEQEFINHYLVHKKPYDAAIHAGYAESTAMTGAYTWISKDKCKENKKHVALEIERRMALLTKKADINAQWVLEKAALLASFNIKKFIKVNSKGDAYYDFTDATDDDWYCIEEFGVDQIAKGKGEDRYDVERIKLKAASKIQALLTVGKHVNVKAFSDRLEVEITDKADILKKARQRAARAKENNDGDES
jgi:phage terminase small subunit